VRSRSTILSEQAVARQRQIADTPACGGEDRVTKRCDEWWDTRLSHSRRRGAFRNVGIRLDRHFIDSSHGIVIEIRSLNDAVLGGYLSAACNARAEDYRSLELRAGGFRMNGSPASSAVSTCSSGWRPFAPESSIVRMSLSAAALISVMHERIASPFLCTVQAPQRAILRQHSACHPTLRLLET
jgi:hypothetical protein